MTKGETVTKPIELGLKKADLQKPPKNEKDKKVQGQGRSEAIGLPGAEVTAMAPRVRKASARPEIAEQIGQQLTRVYKDIVDQPVPDRFLELLQALEAGTPPQKMSRESETPRGTKKAPK